MDTFQILMTRLSKNINIRAKDVLQHEPPGAEHHGQAAADKVRCKLSAQTVMISSSDKH